ELEAKQLDKDYDAGSVALVFALEHLGAREYAAEARGGTRPGGMLKPTGRNELNTMFVGESPVLVHAVDDQVVKHDIRPTFVRRAPAHPAGSCPARHHAA